MLHSAADLHLTFILAITQNLIDSLVVGGVTLSEGHQNCIIGSNVTTI